MMASSRGFLVAGRLAFCAYCDQQDKHGAGRHAIFIAQCFRIRSCDNLEVCSENSIVAAG